MGEYRKTNLNDYLIDAATLAYGETMYVLCDRNISVAAMQDALNAQYGKGVYMASSHGSARYVKHKKGSGWDGSTEVNPCEEPSGPKGARK